MWIDLRKGIRTVLKGAFLPSLVIYLLLCIVCDQEMVKTPVKTAGAPDTKKAFEALAAVNTLQDQVM